MERQPRLESNLPLRRGPLGRPLRAGSFGSRSGSRADRARACAIRGRRDRETKAEPMHGAPGEPSLFSLGLVAPGRRLQPEPAFEARQRRAIAPEHEARRERDVADTRECRVGPLVLVVGGREAAAGSALAPEPSGGPGNRFGGVRRRNRTRSQAPIAGRSGTPAPGRRDACRSARLRRRGDAGPRASLDPARAGRQLRVDRAARASAAARGRLSRMFRQIEEMPEAAFDDGIDWRWGESFEGMLEALARDNRREPAAGAEPLRAQERARGALRRARRARAHPPGRARVLRHRAQALARRAAGRAVAPARHPHHLLAAVPEPRAARDGRARAGARRGAVAARRARLAAGADAADRHQLHAGAAQPALHHHAELVPDGVAADARGQARGVR